MSERTRIELGVVIWMMEKLGADVVENVLEIIEAEKQSVWMVTLDRVAVKLESDGNEDSPISSGASIESINQVRIWLAPTVRSAPAQP
jgi:hypothetical protein